MFSDQDKELIKELNLAGLPEEQQAEGLEKFHNALQVKIGMALEDKLSDSQLEEFEKISAAGDDAATEKWLRQAVPDHEKVMENEMTELKLSIKKSTSEYREIFREDV